MSEDATLDEFVDTVPSEEENQEWKTAKLEDVAWKRSENVDPEEVDIERHVGLEHIEPNLPLPDWESVDGLSSTKRRFEPGDILFAKLRPNLEKSAQPDFEGVASTDIFPIVAKQNINSKYLLYRLSSKSAFDHARRTSVGTRMPRTSWNLFSNFEFELPPLLEQRKIASVLYNIDEAIQKTEETIEQTKQVKAGVAQDLLHTGVEDVKTKKAWMGEIPKHWGVGEFSRIVEISQNGIYKEADEYGGSHPIIKMGDIFGGAILEPPIEERVHLTERELEQYGTEEGDLIFARHAQAGWGAGDCTYVPDLDQKAVVESNMVHMRLSSDANPLFYSQYFNSNVGVKSIKRITTRGNIKSVSQEDLLNLKVPLPPREEQNRIAEVFTEFDERISHAQEQSESLKRLKQGLMQDLLSGTVRTTDAVIEVPDEIAQHG